MKRLLSLLTLIFILGISYNSYAQDFVRNGNTFESTKTTIKSKTEPTKTKFTWKDSKGNEFPIYITENGFCFIIRTSAKTGKEYKSYLNAEITNQICKELGINYKLKNEQYDKQKTH